MSAIKLVVVLIASFAAFAAAQPAVPESVAPTINGPRLFPVDPIKDKERAPHDPVPPRTPAPVTTKPSFVPTVYKKILNPPRKPKLRPTPVPVPDPPTSTPPPTKLPTALPTKLPTPAPFVTGGITVVVTGVTGTCFSGTSTVHVWKRGVTSIKDLQLGDKVLNTQGNYDVVYGFGHYAPTIVGEFFQIKVAGGLEQQQQQSLEISKEHMLFVNGALFPASAVVVGDQLQLGNGEMAKVVKIAKVVRRGLYGPYTMSGTIVVNDIVASCYMEIPNSSMGSGWYTQMFKHVNQAHHRLICKISPAYCLTETYNKNGKSGWKVIPHALMKWSNEQSVWIWLPIVVARMMLFHLPIYMVELILTNNNSSKFGLYLVIAVVSVMLAFYKAKKGHQKKV